MVDFTIAEYDCDDLGTWSLPDLIAEWQEIIDDAPCDPSDVKIEFYQNGDRWDGYGCASITIRRPETSEEAIVRKQKEAEAENRRVQSIMQNERDVYEKLKAKFGG